jgi:1,4-alpha-glucan branching enzyme
MRNGSLMLVLHAHLPYVRHPEHDYFLEENWFYEAVVETYIPLLDMFHRLLNDGVGFRITLSLSPTLLEMLKDPLLNRRLLRHMDGLQELTEKETTRTGGDPSFAPLARMYNKRVRNLKDLYERRYSGDIVGAFRALADTGQVETITTAATHAYLPLLAPFPEAVRDQIRTGVRNHRKHIGQEPAGVWLPECGYYEGLGRILREEGAGFFFLEAHGLLHARPRARYGVFRPIRCPSGPAAFGRDAETARRVWSAEAGYPGHPDYRDFYRDIGHDLPMGYIGPHIHPDGIRTFTGIKYFSVTGNTDAKIPYVRERALRRASEHAGGFIRSLDERASGIRQGYGFSPLIVAPFDAELFGHWWYEGVEWLEHLLRGLDSEKTIRTVTPSEYLTENPGLQSASPHLCSWGDGGFGSTWINRTNSRALRRLHRACEQMETLKDVICNPSALQQRALRQALRELMLASASDWGFLMQKGSHAGYAERRLTGHLRNFGELHGMLTENHLNEQRIEALEERNCLFPEIGQVP